MPDSNEKKYTPPKDLWEVNAGLEFNEPLESDDPRYVDTEPGRGEFSFHSLYTDLGIECKGPRLRKSPEKSYHLFCGHFGCGKSTELRRVSRFLHRDPLYFVVNLDTTEELDTNNLRYPDVMLALAQQLLASLRENNIDLDPVYLENLKGYFAERVLKDERLKELSAEVNTELKAEAGIPFLAKLIARVTNKIKTAATYKEEIREVVKNSFTQFTNAFNQLIGAAENALKAIGKSGKLIFVVDGTDKLEGDDSRKFFIGDVLQLQQVKANFIYCAPIHLLYEGNQIKQKFKQFILPMIKVTHKGNEKIFNDGYRVLRELIYRRVDPSLFESEKLVDNLINCSGGNPRDLLRLIRYAILESDMEQLRETDIKKAIHKLAMDYRMFLDTEDYNILYNIDCSTGSYENSPQVRRLLYNTAILQYNDYWWKSHPAVRELDEYKSLIDVSKSR